MAKTCETLLRGVDASITGDVTRQIIDVTFKSGEVKPGSAFFCIVGFTSDGHRFAQDAVNRGAALLVVERDLELEGAEDVTVAKVEDSRRAMAQIAANFYDNPSESFKLVGVTGTNGKTTTTFITDHIVSAQGHSCGIIGTTGNRVGNVMETANNTTPESVDLQHLFARMRDAGNDIVAMEVSSHALYLQRSFGSKFAVTAFTNLTQDHLDFHKTFEAYFEAKALLFGQDYPARRVICIDDEWGVRLAKRCAEAGDDVLTTGFDESASLHPVAVEYRPDKTIVSLSIRGQVVEVDYPLVGKFNVSNMMTAFAIALQLGVAVDDIVAALRDAPGVPGRLQRLSVPGGPSVFVDYAHTPDAIEKAIVSIRELNPKRLICVFGCGGDRDATKRPLMARAALAADYVFVTSDNPRTEDPEAIIRDILPGLAGEEGRCDVVIDRKEAIGAAVRMAREGEVVLIAGKGHEDFQIIGTTKIHFDDREVAADALAAWDETSVK